MNQLYRALHMPPGRLLRKLTGEKEVYTIAVRRIPPADDAGPLPALGAAPYTQLPGRAGAWFADPMLYRRDGARWLFAEAMDLAAGKGHIEAGRGSACWRRSFTSPSRWCSTGTARPG